MPGLVPVEAARTALLDGIVPVLDKETVPLSLAAGRVLAAPVFASFAVPPFDRSAVDGYGLAAPGTGPFLLAGSYPAGSSSPRVLLPGQAIRLLTGACVPDGVRAVAMQEGCRIDGDRQLRAPVLADGENIRRRGEDVAPGAQLLDAGVRIDPRHLALLASAGLAEVQVRRRARVAVLSSGDELLAPGALLRDAAIHDSNRPMLAALVAASGAEVVDLGLLPDRRGVIAEALAGAAGCDAIVASGGVSGSEADHLLGALRDAGGEGSWTAIALKPGKPLVFGRLGGARCLFLPGNPVAALVGALLFARPLLARLAGHAPRPLRGLPARLAAGWERKAGREEFAPAMVHPGEELFVERVGRPGSARLTPLVAADGLLRVGAGAGTLRAGDMVEFFPFDACFSLA
jgi:molybdopterin molybdotransferase